MKTSKRNNKRTKLNPDAEACFNNYFAQMNKIVPFTTMADWPNQKEMNETSKESSKAGEELLQALKAVKEKIKEEKVKKFQRLLRAIHRS